MRKSSYAGNDYGELLRALVALYQPARIVEFGILDGYSLSYLLRGAEGYGGVVEAYDIFEEFPGHHANMSELLSAFSVPIAKGNLTIRHGDFYSPECVRMTAGAELIHVDIANTGETYRFFISNYLPALPSHGIGILEGGSEERDAVWWMARYNYPAIKPVLDSAHIRYFTLLPFPSVTVVRKEGGGG